ncbi:MAG: Grx4 family monothiol glutaredoxin [Thiotrichales bacterium]|nr:Grx4 family monothiol glutaredoxin [Thiotrichales bacterium]NOX27392.1 Grx4 family monothiol glutaredoxin [Gammaproteobacteria bacterium]
MDIIDQLDKTVKDNDVVLFMKGTPTFPQCGFSSQATQILSACGAKFASINVLEQPEVRANLPQYSNWPTFPQLFINGELVGGSDIMLELYEQGELKKMLPATEEASNDSE